MNRKSINLVLLFTRNNSLENWHRSGTMYRDSGLYQKLQKHGVNTTFVTYGGPKDVQFGKKLGIDVVCNERKINKYLYFILLPLIHFKILRSADVIKSHQFIGVLPAVIAKLLFNKKYIARGGYLPAVDLETEKRMGFLRNLKRWYILYLLIRIDELLVIKFADIICVTCEDEINYLTQRYGVHRCRFFKNTNWIDVDNFKPDQEKQKENNSLIFIGRFIARKNPLLFLKAIRNIPNVSATMIGSGSLLKQMKTYLYANKINCTIVSERIPNEKLPDILNKHMVYVLPTEFEGGSAKTILEAMACGLPAISTDTFGTRNIIIDGENGFMCALTIEEIESKIRLLLEDRNLYERISRNARNYVVRHFSTGKIVKKELQMLLRLFPSRNDLGGSSS